MAPIKQKHIKLQEKYRALSFGEKFVPQLNISGVWLEEIGFKAGETVVITVQQEKLIIEPLKT